MRISEPRACKRKKIIGIIIIFPEPTVGGNAVAVALHSMAHQIQLAVPLVVLSSTRDVNCTVEQDDSGIVAYFFDTTDGGNGASEEIGKQLPLFAAKAMSLALNCECSDGCPKCLIQLGCPQQNQGLHKKVGLFLLEAIAANSST